jgi:hypothetical protein
MLSISANKICYKYTYLKFLYKQLFLYYLNIKLTFPITIATINIIKVSFSSVDDES